MVETQIIDNSINTLDSIRVISKEELLLYAKDYLKKHAFISSKKLATSYLYEQHNFTYKNPEYIRISKSLSHRFRYSIMLLTQERLIVGYNNSSLYKRVEPSKSNINTNIDVSLSSDSSKIDNEILQKTVINSTTPGREQKNCIGPIKLIYHQGKFINPKFYDLE